MTRVVDRNLLLGIIALQLDFITGDALIAAMHAWVANKASPISQVLQDHGALSTARRALLDALVEEHIKLHDGDPQRSLAALSSIGSMREDLARIADHEVRASLLKISARRGPEETDNDPLLTQTLSVGESTSPGLRFRILRPHAKGGLGQVSVALDTELDRPVALKEIQDPHADDQGSRARFVAEAEITGKLEHPGIIPVYGLGHYDNGRPFYAMRFIRGDSLKEAIAALHGDDRLKSDPGARNSRLRELLRRFTDVCNAIAYAHSRGVLHRDLKPGNIMLGPYGETLVVDWGLAKQVQAWLGQPTADSSKSHDSSPLEGPVRLSGQSGSRAETMAGSPIGTPAFASPEQVTGALDRLGPASDVYGLGATLYALLTGRPPVGSSDLGEAIRIVELGEVPAPRSIDPTIPAALEAICKKAMAVNPDNRYPSARALADDVTKWLDDEPVKAYAERLTTRVRRWSRRHQRLVTGSTVAGLVAAIALVAVTAVISISNQRLGAANSKLADANRTISLSNEKITTQYRELEQSNTDLTRARDEAQRDRDQSKEVTEFLVSSFRKPDPAQEGRDVKVADLLAHAVKELEGRPKMAAAMKGRILNALGQTYRGLGLAAERVKVDQTALALRRREFGEDHLETLESMANLAFAYVDSGEINRAISLNEQALEISQRKLGLDHRDTLALMGGLAVAYREAGRFDRAIALHEETLKLQRAKLGDDDPDTLISMNTLGVAYQSAGQFERAIAMHEPTLKLRRAKLGEDHPSTLISMNNLALSYWRAGRSDRAIPLYEETLKIRHVKLGDDHPHTLTTMNNLGLAYLELGQPDRSIPILERTLKAQRVKPGDGHPDTLRTMHNLASAYDMAGHFDRAITLLEQVANSRRAKLGEDHPDTLISMSNLASMYQDSGALDRAIPLYEQLVEAHRAKLGASHPDTIASMNNLGSGFVVADQPERAIPLLERTLDLYHATPGKNQFMTLLTQRNLARAYEGARRFHDAELLYSRTVEAARTSVPHNERFYSGSLALMGRCLTRDGKFTEAVSVLRRCLAVKEKTQPGDWRTANTRSLLGEALTGERSFEEAESLLLAAHETLTKLRFKIQPIDRNPTLRDAGLRLVRLYEAWGKRDETEKWKVKLGLVELPANVFARP